MGLEKITNRVRAAYILVDYSGNSSGWFLAGPHLIFEHRSNGYGQIPCLMIEQSTKNGPEIWFGRIGP